MNTQQCRRAAGKRLDVSGQCVIAWDSRTDVCALPVTYAVDLYEGERAIRLPGHIERVPLATKPGATFKARTGELGAEVHYASLSGAVEHLVSRYRDVERVKGWANA